MTMFSDKFPGSKRSSGLGYDFYLPGDIFLCRKISFPMHIFHDIEKASLALGEFSSLIKRIPDPDLFIRSYLRKEATLSSRIEGTKSEIEDAYMEQQDVIAERRDDWAELEAYINGLNAAIEEELNNRPLCTGLIKRTHKILLSQVRGEHKLPGKFRRSQNWIGGTRPDNAGFVPPAHVYVDDLMGNLEKFIQDKKSDIPLLIKAALIHYQFETIHPFLDGNGRIGRMLISLYLLENKVLQEPILYMSSFFEQHRDSYYLTLAQARTSEEGVLKWVSFFLDGIYQTAIDGIEVTEKLIAYRNDLVENKIAGLGRLSSGGLRLLDVLFARVVVSARVIQQELGMSPQTAQRLIKEFVDLGILKEITGRKRNRMFLMYRYMDIVSGRE